MLSQVANNFITNETLMRVIKICRIMAGGKAYIAVKPENIFEWFYIRINGYSKMSRYSINSLARNGFYAKYSKEVWGN